MEAIASPSAVSMNSETAMLRRLCLAFAKCTRTVIELHHRLLRKSEVRIQETGLATSGERIDQIAIVPANEQNKNGSEFLQTQSQLVSAMLHSMIIASGDNVGDSKKRKRP